MRARSLYDVLGVQQDATDEQIKTAFRRHARSHHPDTAGGDKDAEERFKEISQAYAILGNKRERQRYDRGDIDERGAVNRAGTRSRSKTAETSAAGPSTNRTIKVAGADVSYTLRIGLEEAVNGARKTIGTTNGKHLSVSIPPKTKPGQVLRLKGQGMPGIGGGSDGDALIEIVVDKRGSFHVDDRDVHLDVPISLKEAVLGARIALPSVDTKLIVAIPPNSNSGDVLRVPGKGLESETGDRGDLLLRLTVVLPKRPDAALSAFLRDWSPSEPFDAREGPTEKKSSDS